MEPDTPPARRRRVFGLLSAGWWAGIGGIAAVIALVPVVINKWDGSPTDGSSTSDPSSVAIDGYCNAQGTGNSANCTFVPSPQSMAEVKFRRDSNTIVTFFAGTPDELPTPPDYQHAFGHCQDWDTWLRTTPGMYLVDAGVDVQLQTGEPDLITVTAVRVEIFKRTPVDPGTGTVIQCAYGGGSNSYYTVDVDTVHQTTTVTEGELVGGRPQQMPPASISLDQKGFRTVRIGLSSLEGHLYEGRIVVSVIVNGASKDLAVGSPEVPLRWIQRDSRFGGTYYDWDMQIRTWVKDFKPGS